MEIPMTRPDASPPPRSNDFSIFPSVIVTLALVVSGWALPASADPAAAASPPAPAPTVSLSNADVGMSAEQIETAQAPAPAPTPDVPPAPTEATSELASAADDLAAVAEDKKQLASALERRAQDANRALEAAEAGLIPGVGPNEEGPATYESCVEAMIRRGDSFASSDRLCRVVYPAAADLGKHAPRSGEN